MSGLVFSGLGFESCIVHHKDAISGVGYGKPAHTNSLRYEITESFFSGIWHARQEYAIQLLSCLQLLMEVLN